MGREVPIAAEPKNRRADLRIFLADCSQLVARTNWRPKRGVERTVADVFGWARAHEKKLQPLI
jgi:nucleoside-diphosphate-sugar epimerase